MDDDELVAELRAIRTDQDMIVQTLLTVAQCLERIEAHLDDRPLSEEPRWLEEDSCGGDDLTITPGVVSLDDEPRDTLSDAYSPVFPERSTGTKQITGITAGWVDEYDQATQSVQRRTWDPVAGRWVYQPEP